MPANNKVLCYQGCSRCGSGANERKLVTYYMKSVHKKSLPDDGADRDETGMHVTSFIHIIISQSHACTLSIVLRIFILFFFSSFFPFWNSPCTAPLLPTAPPREGNDQAAKRRKIIEISSEAEKLGVMFLSRVATGLDDICSELPFEVCLLSFLCMFACLHLHAFFSNFFFQTYYTFFSFRLHTDKDRRSRTEIIHGSLAALRSLLLLLKICSVSK